MSYHSYMIIVWILRSCIFIVRYHFKFCYILLSSLSINVLTIYLHLLSSDDHSYEYYPSQDTHETYASTIIFSWARHLVSSLDKNGLITLLTL